MEIAKVAWLEAVMPKGTPAPLSPRDLPSYGVFSIHATRAAKTAHEKTILERQITATDHQIDQLVYKLYGLTADEIKIVEEATTRA
ncbi:MAG: hypothetical protein AB7U87_05090 [Candidatus Bipolaricaulis sp.]